MKEVKFVLTVQVPDEAEVAVKVGDVADVEAAPLAEEAPVGEVPVAEAPPAEAAVAEEPVVPAAE